MFPLLQIRNLSKLTLMSVFLFFIPHGSLLQAQNWTQIGTDIDYAWSDLLMGDAVSLSADGNRVAIGAPGGDGFNGFNFGWVYVYEKHDTGWARIGNVIAGENQNDYSGRAVSLSADGSTVIVGAARNDGVGNDAGHIRIYEYDTIANWWNQKGNDIDGQTAGDWFGQSVSVSNDGNTIASGAIYADAVFGLGGQVRIYSWNGNSWVQKGGDLNPDAFGDGLGSAVSLSADGSVVAIGASNGNYVRTYQWNGSSWVQRGGDILGETSGDGMGKSLRLSSDANTLAVGAPYNGGNGAFSGHVQVYSWNGNSWVQKGGDLEGEAAGDYFGISLDLSSNGNVLIAGAENNQCLGFESGHARVFEWDGSSWNQVGADIDAEYSADKFGHAVAMSADGNKIAIGAPSNGNNGCTGAGHVRCFSSPYNVAIQKLSFNSDVSYFPNPTEGLLNIDLGAEYANINIKLINTLGQVLSSENYELAEKIQLELLGETGIYFIEIKTKDNKTAVLRVLKS